MAFYFALMNVSSKKRKGRHRRHSIASPHELPWESRPACPCDRSCQGRAFQDIPNSSSIDCDARRKENGMCYSEAAASSSQQPPLSRFPLTSQLPSSNDLPSQNIISKRVTFKPDSPCLHVDQQTFLGIGQASQLSPGMWPMSQWPGTRTILQQEDSCIEFFISSFLKGSGEEDEAGIVNGVGGEAERENEWNGVVERRVEREKRGAGRAATRRRGRTRIQMPPGSFSLLYVNPFGLLLEEEVRMQSECPQLLQSSSFESSLSLPAPFSSSSFSDFAD